VTNVIYIYIYDISRLRVNSTNTMNAYYFKAENGLFEGQFVPTRTGQLP